MKAILLSSALLLATTAPALAQKPAKLKYPTDDNSRVYDAVEQPAVPKGGPQGYADYLASHQKYPTAAMQAKQEGTVMVTFVVEKSGGIGEVEVKQPIAPLLDAEAIRVIKAAPKWTPAHHKGKVVRQRVTVPVSFVLAEGSGEVVEMPAPGSARPSQPLPPGGARRGGSGARHLVGDWHHGQRRVHHPARKGRAASGRHHRLFCLDCGQPEVPGFGPQAQDAGQGTRGVYSAARRLAYRRARAPKTRLGAG
jgi:TonB family protein